jgi:hypothetical protein
MASVLQNRHRVLIAAVIVMTGAAACIFYFSLPGMVRTRAAEVLSGEFGGAPVKFQNLVVSGFPRLHVVARGVTIGADPDHPLIQADTADADTALLPWHVRRVRLSGLAVRIPGGASTIVTAGKSWPAITIEEIAADKADVEILAFHFELAHVRARNFNPSGASSFAATLVSFEPRADIALSGRLGPWNAQQPSLTPVEGAYKLTDGDLASLPGLKGVLTAQGSFQGALRELRIAGPVSIAAFGLSSSGRPEALRANLRATINAADQSASIESIDGSLEDSLFSAGGAVRNLEDDRTRKIAASISLQRGRLQDILPLGVQSKTSPLAGAVRIQAKVEILPGERDIVNRLRVDAGFDATAAKFSSFDLRERLRNLSRKAEGRPGDPSAGSSLTGLQGQIALADGVATFPKLAIELDGASAHLQGTYRLADERLDLRGDVAMDAQLSQTTTGPKKLLLKVVDPFFRGKHGGSRVPIKVAGTRENPQFALDFGSRIPGRGPGAR